MQWPHGAGHNAVGQGCVAQAYGNWLQGRAEQQGKEGVGSINICLWQAVRASCGAEGMQSIARAFVKPSGHDMAVALFEPCTIGIMAAYRRNASGL